MSPTIWPSLAIALMWVAVLFVGLFGPNIDTSNGAGTNTSSVPSAVAIALFAFLSTWVVAHYAFRRARAVDARPHDPSRPS
jgi:hypothetical protein